MMSKISILQLPTLSMSESRIDYYLNLVSQNGVKIVVLGEYILNSFFSELKNMQQNLILEQTNHKIEIFEKLSKRYDLIIIAPIILVKQDKIFKVVAKFSPTKTIFTEQNFLIPYSHWNEAGFFSNLQDYKKLKFLTFAFEKIKFGVMFGYEAHFDASWEFMRKNGVECVLMPVANTFETNERWNELLKMRAFTNSMQILRANKIGKAKFSKDEIYDFYGYSSNYGADGNLINFLKNEEGILEVEISKKQIQEIAKNWKFKEIYNKI